MGFFLGLLSSATFGLIPLFTLPLLHAGVTAESALFYRFCIASITLWGLLAARGECFRARGVDLCKLAGLSIMYMLAALLFFWAFSYLPSGVAATLQFLYPVMVMLIMIVFFHERFSWTIALSIVLAVSGVALLSGGPSDGGRSISLLGVGMMLLSALCNSLYIVGIQTARIPNMSGLVMTFYVMLFSAVLSLVNALCTGRFQALSSWRELGIAALLAVVTAVMSNLTLILAIQRIGSTMTSVLGVMEPLTAVTVGILVFGEPFSPSLAGGVALIAASVLLVMLGRQIRTVLRKFRA
ncbi:MAG: DMT family transporter [Desulfovibrio sp.]|uniref:DMT family transporter n=1 Tax=Desulfovibrio sp. TaxID=885 RepID=UPI00258DCDD7|nr:DMT family transporter [Desulfovibrio sp.]MCD7984800.1 DMT family transporter [Desulfovibrio sp.]